MFFNSIDFALFLPVFFILYWFVVANNLKLQNFLIVAASYLFYGWWDKRFLFLILFSTIVDFIVGRKLRIEKNQNRRKILLWTSILINIGLLSLFKYYNFFLDNFVTAFTLFGNNIKVNSLNIILPVGISFYTFQTLSYTIDVYKRKLEPTNNFIAFSAFVSFFPQLVAGPIEKAKNLLPQFYKKRKFDYILAADGMRQILWGLFKKIVIADNCAEFANQIFDNSSNMNGSTLLLGAMFFTFQIYGDFSGYSDIAIGTSRLFGFNLVQNFNFPYFSRDVAEFWRRWHISLSNWFRDYLYIPLGGSQKGTWIKIRNTFTVFIVSGFWHGADWTFIFWGLLNALYFLPLLILKKTKVNIDIVAKGKFLPTIKEAFQMSITFCLTLFAWIFFRAESMGHALSYISTILSKSVLETPQFSSLPEAKVTLLLIVIFILVEWQGRKHQFAIEDVKSIKSKRVRWFRYTLILMAIYTNGSFDETIEFIYFQF